MLKCHTQSSWYAVTPGPIWGWSSFVHEIKGRGQIRKVSGLGQVVLRKRFLEVLGLARCSFQEVFKVRVSLQTVNHKIHSYCSQCCASSLARNTANQRLFKLGVWSGIQVKGIPADSQPKLLSFVDASREHQNLSLSRENPTSSRKASVSNAGRLA